MQRIIESLTLEQITNIIPVIEQGIEFEALKYPATKDPESLSRISDSCLFLSLLYLRKMHIDGSSIDLPDCLH